MSNNNSFGQVVKLANSREKVPALQIVRDVNLAAMLSKAVDPMIQPLHTPSGSRKIEAPGLAALHTIGARTAGNIAHADTVMQMLPDMQLGSQILVSSVASPKDMMTLSLSYKTTADILPPTVMASAIGLVRDHFDAVYKIKDKIPRILQEVLFDKGSHIVAIIPENSIDEMINRNNAVSMEAFHEAMGVGLNSNLSPEQALSAPLGILGPGINGYLDKEVRRSSGLSSMTFSIGNESLEDIYKAYGSVEHKFSQKFHYALDNGQSVALEGINITDNPNILRIPKIEEKLRRDAVNAKLGINVSSMALESYGNYAIADGGKMKFDDRSLKNLIYKPRKRGMQPMSAFKTDNQLARRSIGHPLLMELPPESVIPVYTPGQEDRHVGYFILLDQTGNPVKAQTEKDSFGDLSARMMRGTNQTTNIGNRLRQLTDGLNCSEADYTETMVRVYADMVEQDLLARVRNGMRTNSVALAKNTDYYRVMLARVHQQQSTTILFMPADMVTYFARKYNQYGIGVSILDEMKILNNMRAIAMMGNTHLGIRNSIPRTDVNINIDETDPDPYKTAEMLINEISRVNQTQVPFGASAPVDIADYFQRAQYKIRISGHPAIPETNVEYTESATNYSKVDTELEESLQKRTAMAMGLNSETINNGFNSETATSVVANNLMLSRRVMVIQDQINPHITDYHRKIIRADSEIFSKLRELLFNEYEALEIDEEEIAKQMGHERSDIKQLVIDHILHDFIEGLEVTLPRPNTATVENQKTALEAHSELLDVAIDAYLSDKFFTDETGGELSRNVESIKMMIKAHFIREFMAENGIMPELAALVTLTDDNQPEINLWEEQVEHIKKLTATMSGFMKKIHKTKQDSNAEIERLNATAGGPDGGSSDYSSSSSNDNDTDPDDNDPADDDPFSLDAMPAMPELSEVGTVPDAPPADDGETPPV